MCRNRTEASVPANRRNRWIIFHGHETHVVKFERLEVDRFLNQITVLVTDVLEFSRRDAYIEGAASGVTIPGGFEPRLKGLPYDLFF
jgi:hypothetical protein